MKFFSIYVTLTLMLLGSNRANAQTECPNIEWMRFFNDTNTYYCNLVKIDSNHDCLFIGLYGGNPSWGTYNFPPAVNYLPNKFIGKSDSAGVPLWIKVAKAYSPGFPFGISTPIEDSLGNIYTTIDFKWKIDFGGTTYIGSPQKGNALFVKMNPQGQVVDTYLFENLSDYQLNLFHVDRNSNYYFVADLRSSLVIDGHTYTSNGGIDYLVFKLNNQFQLQWAKQIGGTNDQTVEAWDVDSNDNIYLSGQFNSSGLTLGSTQLHNPYSNTGTNETYVTKINSTGTIEWATQLGIQSTTAAIASSVKIGKDNNIFLSGNLKGELMLDNNPIVSQPVNEYNSFLIKYSPSTQQFSSIILNGGENLYGDLLYLPAKDMMLLSGWIAPNNTINFNTQNITSNNGDFFVVGVDLNDSAATISPQWVIHSQGNGDEGAPGLTKDFENNIYLWGGYLSTTGNGEFGNYVFPGIPPGGGNNIFNGYQAKLGNFLNREVSVNNGILTAVQNNALYQWLDCSNGMQPIAGATGQSFSPAQPGNYAVRVSNSLCSVVSDCINTTGITENQLLQQIHVYPNPVQQQLNLSHLPLDAQVAVYDVLGRTVYSGISEKESLQINTRQWVAGLYMVALRKGGAQYLVKIVKRN